MGQELVFQKGTLCRFPYELPLRVPSGSFTRSYQVSWPLESNSDFPGFPNIIPLLL